MSVTFEALVTGLTVEMVRPVAPYEPVARPGNRTPTVSVAQSDEELTKNTDAVASFIDHSAYAELCREVSTAAGRSAAELRERAAQCLEDAP